MLTRILWPVFNSIIFINCRNFVRIRLQWNCGNVCLLSQSSESNSSPADCSEILLEEMSGRLTSDSGHCSASSASLADSTDTTNGNSPQPSYIVALHRKMVRIWWMKIFVHLSPVKIITVVFHTLWRVVSSLPLKPPV